ncbi:MAG: class I SAM-dependent methyltransferase [Cyanobacteria bacterium J06635_15]
MKEPGSATHFDDNRAAKYDHRIRMIIPAYESLHQMVNHLLNSLLPVDAHILVVGAGTGMDIITCGAANPKWTFTAVEPSDAMFATCQKNIAASRLKDRVQMHCGYIDDLSKDLKFDAATAILVSHFIQDEQEKFRFFSKIAAFLQNKAPFVVADLQGDKDSEEFQLLIKSWRHLFSSLEVTAKDFEEAFNHIQKDISFVPEHRYQKLLEESGFGHMLNFYRAYLFGG